METVRLASAGASPASRVLSTVCVHVRAVWSLDSREIEPISP